jgi:phosphoglycerol transferase
MADGVPTRGKLTGARPWLQAHLADVVGSSSAAFGSLGVAMVALRVWRGRLDVPFQIRGDGGFYLMLVKGVLDHGWIWTNSSLGAPFGQQLYDFPQGADNLNLLIIKVLGAVVGSAATTANLFFLLSFPLTALGAYVVFRWLEVSVPSAALCAVLFSILPVHFLGGEDRLLLNAAYAVPLGAYLVLAVLRGDHLLVAREGPGRLWRRALTRRTVATLVICAVVGSAGLYYAAFTIVLLVLAGVGRFAVRLTVRSALLPLVLVAIVGGVLALNLAPSIAYRVQHGSNSSVAARAARDTETYALKLTLLVLPQPGHRVPFLARLNERYGRNSLPGPNEGFVATLGIVGTVGAAILFIVGLTMLLGARPSSRRRALCAASAAAALLAFLVATQGGISSIVANWVSPEIRVWSRMSMFITFYSLLAVGLALDRGVERIGPGRARRFVPAAAVVVIGIVGALDQTNNRTHPSYGETIPAYGTLQREWRSDEAFVSGIEARLPKGAAVYQLPYVYFPEDLTSRTGAYEPARFYLHSSRLRWSWGAMRGRPADWASRLARASVPATTRAVAAAGFQGITVDRRGYADGGNSVVSRLTSVLRAPPLSSPDGRFVFFDLRPYAGRLRASLGEQRVAAIRQSTLRPR